MRGSPIATRSEMQTDRVLYMETSDARWIHPSSKTDSSVTKVYGKPCPGRKMKGDNYSILHIKLMICKI